MSRKQPVTHSFLKRLLSHFVQIKNTKKKIKTLIMVLMINWIAHEN